MATSKNGRTSFSSSSNALLAIPYTVTPGESRNFDLTTTSQDPNATAVADPAYLFSQLKSSEWLQRYGLKSQKLKFDQILQQIGFKRVESFTASIGKTVGAKYAGNLYHEIQQDNGDRYVLTCRPEKLHEYRNRLSQILNLLRKRLVFLSSGSRRVFGIIGEPSVCVVCDCKTSDHRIFHQYQLAVSSLFKEQIIKLKRFNIIWVSNENEQFQPQPIDITVATIDQAIDWIHQQKCVRNKISISATCEAILKAFRNTVHSIYLISEGDSSDGAREILRDNIVRARLSSNTPIPIHVVSLFAQNNDTEIFLNSIAQTANGSFFTYKIKNERTNLQESANLTEPTRLRIEDNKLQVGTNVLQSKLEQPIDISLMYKEINECQNTIDRLDKILGFVKDDKEKQIQKPETTKSLDVSKFSNTINENNDNLQRSLIIQSSALFNYDENDMASIDWLKSYGIEAQKLDFFSALNSAAFRHCDGIVTLYKPPENSNEKPSAPANSKDKLINAKYCDQFAHVTWPDGTIRHVYVTPEIHRDYERRMKALLEKIRARLSWLKKGSRDVFGTILEKNIYILIDTSKSMHNHMTFIKDKLRLLLQDQLFSKERINMVSFNTIINTWRDRLTKVNDPMTSTQLQPWIDELHAEGSTNTLAALRFALADSATDAIYLLTDGRPDQNERHILSQVQYRQVIPIHTIAFNCQDQTANQFLFDLSKQSGGRFHAFNYGYETESTIEIPESEDISFLKKELIRGEKDLQRVTDLRDECLGRAWSRDNAKFKHKSPELNALSISLPYRSKSIAEISTQSNDQVTMPQQLDRKKRSSSSFIRKHKIKSAQSFDETNVYNLNSSQWLLPETVEYLQSKEKKEKKASTLENEEEEQQQPLKIKSAEPMKKNRTPFDEVKFYLKKNSLVAKGLTIFDVLHPTTVTVKQPHHVQVIDRYILSKVWDDLLPLVSSSYINKFRLVNHYALDLENYQIKLSDLIINYYQFTSKFIWKCLNDDEKRKLGPRVYWINLSNENQNKFIKEITSDQHTSQNPLELFVWNKLTGKEQNDFLEKPVVYNDKTETILKDALKNADADSAFDGVSLMDVEIKNARKFLQISTYLRQNQTFADTETKHKLEQKQIVKRKSSNSRIFGQRVLCRYDGDGYFYPGTIQKNSDGRTVVLFDTLIEQDPMGHTILPLNNLSNQLKLFQHDCVFARQIRDTEEYWAPGLILCVPSAFLLPNNLYRIHLYDPYPRKVFLHRKDLIRISLTLFQRSVSYLENISQMSVTNQPFTLPEPESETRPSSPNPQFEKLLQEMLNPLMNEIEKVNKSSKSRYEQLQRALEDQMGAIRILQEQPTKSSVKFEYAQTYPIPTPEETPRLQTPTPTVVRPVIPTNTRVYAVWNDDDGLVYEGIIVKNINSDEYRVERLDLPGVQSIISRDDIFLDSDRCPLKTRPAETFAFIEYPNEFRHFLSPAVIGRHRSSEPKVKVVFYDCFKCDILNNQYVIPINEKQFEKYSTFRIDKEKSLINQVIVGFNNQAKLFMLGTIIDRVGNGHQYLIEWPDETRSEQNIEHLFGAFHRRDEFFVGSYVLAVDNNDMIYKPAKIKSISNDKKFAQIQFINSRNFINHNDDSSANTANVSTTTTFVISETYFNKMINRLHS